MLPQIPIPRRAVLASLCGIAACAVGLASPAAGQGAEAHRPIPDHVLGPERNTIEVFRGAADSVVFVTNERVQRRFGSLDLEKIPQNTGSGIIWDERGHVLTNYHVIQGSDTLSVAFSDGSSHEARVVGSDPNKDLAVLRVDVPPERLAPIARGVSSSLVVGQKVLAIGNPFGLDHTLTVGVISALGREIQSVAGTTIEDVIQTDASINPGNSGGPLLDSAGRMIGVNTQILSRSGQSAGIGFAVPVDTVERIVPQLITYGRVRRAGLGIRILPDAYARRWGIAGVIVRDVNRGSPAEQAGLRALRVDRRGNVVSFDVITGIGEQGVASYDDLYRALDGRKPGERVTVRFERDGRGQQTSIPLQELE